MNKIYRKIIYIPTSSSSGGVRKYYEAVIEHFRGKHYTYFERGLGGHSNSKYLFLQRTIHLKQIFKFFFIRKNYDVHLFNVSLGKGGLLRDFTYQVLLNRKKQKLIIFFHGWNPYFEIKINNSRILKSCLFRTFLKADHIIVLSSEFKKKLREWGYKGKISAETTVVEENLLKDFNYREKKPEGKNLLFLSRVEKAKGIFEAVDAVNILLTKDMNIHFKIAGNGSAMDDLKKLVNSLKTDSISMVGYVKGEDKINCLTSANLFIFPSYHEGMPLSVLEAMAFGLPIVTTRVGGIPDFFEEGKMGLFLDTREPGHIAEKIEYLLNKPELMKEMSEYNYNYAKEHFYASNVAARLEKIIDDVAEERV